jgi:hypothetical protein
MHSYFSILGWNINVMWGHFHCGSARTGIMSCRTRKLHSWLGQFNLNKSDCYEQKSAHSTMGQLVIINLIRICLWMSFGQRWEMKNVRLSALGAHQQENALTAISTVLSLRHQGWWVQCICWLGPQAGSASPEGFSWARECVWLSQDWILGFSFFSCRASY